MHFNALHYNTMRVKLIQFFSILPKLDAANLQKVKSS